MGANFPQSAPVAANGQATVRFQNQTPGIRFEVRQVACYTGLVTNNGSVALFKNGFLVTPSAALTPLPPPFGVGASAGGLPYIDLVQGDYLDAMFAGCLPGDIAYANFMYEEYYVGSQVPITYGY